MYVELVGYDIFSGNKKDLISKIFSMKKVNIVSGNPEILNLGLNNKKLFKFFTSEQSIIIPDGVGTVIASKIIKNPVQEKIAGIEVMDEIIKVCHKEEKGIYLLGAKEEILQSCKKNLKEKYPNLKILGSHNGYFDINNCEDIINEIKACKPYAIFVAMGAPKQEEFIIRNMKDLPVSIFMGVGGSFDVISGKVSRAPKWMINLGLEWLHRTLKNPARIKRLGVIPKFLFIAIKNK
ncbi:MAG: WecB/TagA/CpsF family glycosyltransferase [Clostridium sp.]